MHHAYSRKEITVWAIWMDGTRRENNAYPYISRWPTSARPYKYIYLNNNKTNVSYKFQNTICMFCSVEFIWKKNWNIPLLMASVDVGIIYIYVLYIYRCSFPLLISGTAGGGGGGTTTTNPMATLAAYKVDDAMACAAAAPSANTCSK
jgi:hypothetical protein